MVARFPVRSETFVYREIRALRRRGWAVHVASLYHSPINGDPSFADLAQDLIGLYGPKTFSTVRVASVELLAHPVASVKTLIRAALDAVAPGEPLAITLRFKLMAQAWAAMALAHRLRDLGVNHIHCHFAHSPTTVGMYAARQLSIPFSFTGHANDIFHRRVLLGRKLRRAGFVSCISHWHRVFYREICAKDDTHYRIIRCGIDIGAWTVNQAKVQQVAEPAALRILTVARLVEKKGIDTLIRALHDLRVRHQVTARLTIAGDGPDRNGLELLSQSLGCARQITFLGSVSNEAVMGLMHDADLLSLPCRTDSCGDRDGIPVVLVEAMACGLPVIAGDLPAIRELIEHNVSGILVDGSAVTQLADEIAALHADPGRRHCLAAAARQRVESEFSMDLNVERLEAAFAAQSGMNDA